MPGLSVFARAIPATLSGFLVLTLGACTTPVLRSEVDVPDQFAAAAESEAAPEVAWWERYADPVLSDLIHRAARENRDVKIAAERVRAARAGETISRSSLLPNFGARGLRASTTIRMARPTVGERLGRARRVLGDRCRRRASRRRVRRDLRQDRNRRRRAGRPAARPDGRRDELLHAGRRSAPARDGSCDLGGTGRDAASRHRAASRGPCLHVRRRARPDAASSARAAIPPLETLRRGLAASDCRPDRRSGIERNGGRRPLERHRGRSGCAARTTGDAPRAPPGSARLPRAARSRQLAASGGRGGVVPAPLPQRPVRPPGRRGEWDRLWNGALHQRLRPPDDAHFQLGTDARQINEVAESRPARSIAEL